MATTQLMRNASLTVVNPTARHTSGRQTPGLLLVPGRTELRSADDREYEFAYISFKRDVISVAESVTGGAAA